MLGLLAVIPGAGSVISIVARVFGFLLRCTPCLIALAVLGAWIVGDIHGHRKESEKWSAKWEAAEVQAEKDRLARDARAKLAMQLNVDARLQTLAAGKDELEKRLKDYEDNPPKAVAGDDKCVGTRADDEWLRDARRPKPKAGRGLADRLRAFR